MTMKLVSFSKRYPGEFLSRTEDNFDLLLDKIKMFYNASRAGIQDGEISRRVLNNFFDYQEEIGSAIFNEKGLSSQEITAEFSDMISGCIRHQDPTTAFNIIPAPLLDTIAGLTLAGLYNSNSCWDFISGKLCLYEKKIIRMLGNLVGWSKSDGFVITGGKQAIAYAIKNGIYRSNASNPMKMEDSVVICSSLAHYSVEHVCHYLGIHPNNCLRIATHSSGEIDLKALKKYMKQAVNQKKKIATVIAAGGGTINLIPDPITGVKDVIDQVVMDCELDYTPYLHVDSVITWAWLAFEADKKYFEDRLSHPNSLKKIHSVREKLSGIEYADSFAADFHKTGFCPYSAGVFISRESKNLFGMATSNFVPKKNPCFGELEPFKQTFENSRSSLPIVSIWIAIRKMGLEGLKNFVLYQLDVCEIFKQKIREKCSEHFEILNEHSNGWEIVIKPYFKDRLSWDHLQKSSINQQQKYINSCYAFLNDFWYAPMSDPSLKHPVIGFIPKYSRKGIYEKSFPAFLIHPTSLHYDNDTIDEMAGKILEAKTAFDSHQSNANSGFAMETLYAIVPPK